MKELKYRVWDGTRIVGEYDAAIVDGRPYVCNGLDPIEPYPEGSEIILYTGLNDQDGKEIFDGDIIEADFYDIHLTSEVFFDEGAYSVVFEDDGQYVNSCLFELDNIRVVGNKFENPELMKV